MLSAQELALSKTQRTLLCDIDFELPAGQLLGVIGPNGAGKSSLIKILAGLWQPTQGHVQLGKAPVASLSLSQRSTVLAWLGQQNSVAFDFSVQQVVALGPQRAKPITMTAAMQLFGVQELAERNISTLSGGQQQRVHLARVFSQLNGSENDADQCLLLDEPLNGLDLRWQQRCLNATKTWVAQCSQRHAVMAIHDIGLAATACDQVLVLNEGMIEYMGPPAGISEALLEQVWRYPLTIQRNNNQTLVYAKAEEIEKP